MSIVLDVVQKIVLHGAYELTCSAAFEVVKRCQSLDEKKGGKCVVFEEKNYEDQTDGAINIHLPELTQETDTSKPDAKEIEVSQPVSLLDLTFKNSGPICPPKTSCMRLARNSYFS